MHPEKLGDIAHCLTFLNQPTTERHLVGCKCRRATKSYSFLLRDDSSGTGAAKDQRALELGDAGKHGQHHATGRARCVRPRLGEATQAGTGITKPLSRVQQVTSGASKAVKPCDNEHILVAHLVKQSRQLGTVALSTGKLLLIDATATHLSQRAALKGKVLVVGTNARIAQEHGIVAKVVEKVLAYATDICNNEMLGLFQAPRLS